MDDILGLIEHSGTKIAEKLTGKFFDLLYSSVISRMSKQRADNFVKTFCMMVAEGKKTEEVVFKLEELMKDSAACNALFDAYRRVSLSASTTIGPKIIALITARIVGQKRDASIDEIRTMTAAEVLTDSEFEEMRETFHKIVKTERKVGRYFFIPGHQEDSAGINLWDDWGSWAGKLSQVGFVTSCVRVVQDDQMIREYEYLRNPKLITDIYFDDTIETLVELLELVGKVEP